MTAKQIFAVAIVLGLITLAAWVPGLMDAFNGESNGWVWFRFVLSSAVIVGATMLAVAARPSKWKRSD
jgi:hypothetical protein